MLAGFPLSALGLALALAAPPFAPLGAPAMNPEKVELPKLDPASVTSLQFDPPSVVLVGPLARHRLLAAGLVAGKSVDLSDRAEFSVADPKIARLGPGLELVPLAGGVTRVVAKFGGKTAECRVEVKQMSQDRPIHFTNEVVPIFTRLGCNSGGCHGKSGGQNGFHLSLLGFEAKDDYDFLVKDSRGRRLFPAAPEHSLLLRKASGQLPHGGGALMKSGDDNHRLIAAWVAQGMPRGDEKAPVVASLEIEPKTRILSKGDSQRLRVIAVYTDGRREDATRHAVFGSNNDDVAGVEKDGRVRVKQQSGEAAISARYQAQVAVFRAFVPSVSGQSAKIASVPFVRRNLIDDLVAKKWADLGIGPSRPTTDAEFVRRVYLDLAGRFPKPEESARFLSSKSSDKRDALIDELLDGPDYPGLMAMKWGAILQNQRGERNDQAPATHAFAAWLRDAFASDMPYDVFVRAILAAAGTPEQNPPSTWYRNLKGREEMADAFAQVFLGTRIQCARCHHHPNEKWGQEDYAGLTSFFARVQRKPAGRTTDGRAYDAITVARQGVATHPRSGQAVLPHGLDATPKPVPAGDDPRARLADWTTAPENPLFARALVNRLWGHLFGRGIVEPVDDFRLTNPPTNPELLDAMVAEFNRGGRRLKPLLKLMASSATYQLSSEPTPANADDRQNYARYYPRRLPAEILSDALDQVTGVATGLLLPAGMRAIDLPDEAGASYLLDVFGRPQRASACECERSSEANLGQSLHLLNGAEVQAKLANQAGRAVKLADDKRPDREKLTELYAWFFARTPTAPELKVATEYLAAAKDKRVAWQNLVWALLNSKEFCFNL